MRLLSRDKKTAWYCPFDRVEPVKDEYGNETGERRVFYKPAVEMRVNVSAAAGTAQMEQFGNFPGYDRVVLIDDTDNGIDENSVLFLDKQPEYSEDGSPLYDFVVKKVAKSPNVIAVAVAQVVVS